MSTENFLRDFHEKHPGCTSQVLSTGLTADGLTSYDVVASGLPEQGPLEVLDLACGDGFLLERVRAPGRRLHGVDLSPDELAAARRRLGGDVALHEARAQKLPFADAAVDAVLCHLAFMLMDEIEVVVGELHRVLRPGGVFSAVVPGGAHDDAATAVFREVFGEILAEEGLPRPQPLGDDRTRSPEGLRGLFAGPRFASPVRTTDFLIQWRVPPEAVVEYFALTYGVGRLPPPARARWAERFRDRLRPLQVDGSVEHAKALCHLVAVKRAGS